MFQQVLISTPTLFEHGDRLVFVPESPIDRVTIPLEVHKLQNVVLKIQTYVGHPGEVHFIFNTEKEVPKFVPFCAIRYVSTRIY